MGIPALCFAHAANSSRPVPALVYIHSVPPPRTPRRSAFSLAGSGISLPACLPTSLPWSSVSLHPRCWCILTPHLSSLPFLPLFLLPGHQPPPICIHGPLVSSWDLLSGTPGWLVQLPATCLYSQVLLVILSMDRRGAHCHLSPDSLTEPQPSSVSPVQSPMPPAPPSRWSPGLVSLPSGIFPAAFFSSCRTCCLVQVPSRPHLSYCKDSNQTSLQAPLPSQAELSCVHLTLLNHCLLAPSYT